MSKAYSVWQWFNYYSKGVPDGRRLLRLNMDETSVCLFQGEGKGDVFLAKQHRVRQNVKAGDCRKYFTHVAFICDDVAIKNAAASIDRKRAHDDKS